MLLIVLATASARTLAVPSTAYPTLTEAVGDAVDGDEVVITGPITLTGSVVVDKAILIRGDGAVLDGAAAVSHGFLLADGARLQDLTINMGGTASRCVYAYRGEVALASVRCEDSSAAYEYLWVNGADVTLDSGEMSGLTGIYAPVYMGDGSLVVDHTVFENKIGASSGAITANYGGSLYVRNSTFRGNTGAAGAIQCYLTRSCVIEDTVFEANHALTGGALRCDAPCELRHVTFLHNTSASYAAGVLSYSAGVLSIGGYVEIEDSVFQGNSSTGTGYGGAMTCLYGAICVIRRSEFVGNSAVFGGGIYGQVADLVVDESTFCGNSATTQGGGVYLYGGSLQAERSVFVRNSAVSHGGAFITNGYANPARAIIQGNTFVANSSPYGAAVSFYYMTAYRLYHNIVTDQTGSVPILITAGAGGTGYNLYYNNQMPPSPFETTSVSADPMFASNHLHCDTLNLHPLREVGPSASTLPGTAGALQPVDLDGDGVYAADDCDDTDADAHDGAMWWPDLDGDGAGDAHATVTLQCHRPFGMIAVGGDCDDTDSSIYPSATEYCDGIDQNCDGIADDGLPVAHYATDADGDGFGDPSMVVLQCDRQDGSVLDATDCDDTSSHIYPGAPEVCNGVDDDCDGDLDEELEYHRYYPDADEDGFGDSSAIETLSCVDLIGMTLEATDCDDTEPTVFPGAPERCDQLDNDCNGHVDDAANLPLWYVDQDGDGYGAGAGEPACEPSPGRVAITGDCNDSVPTTHPGATDTCNGVDDDCDGAIDGSGHTQRWYADADGDGFGGDTTADQACAPPGYVATSTDCDDHRDDVFPGAPERCDGLDNDCNGPIDDLENLPLWYDDLDGDGHGAGEGEPACGPGPSQVATADDCDDTERTVSPTAKERCGDSLDNNCDGEMDEGCEERPEGCACSYDAVGPLGLSGVLLRFSARRP